MQFLNFIWVPLLPAAYVFSLASAPVWADEPAMAPTHKDVVYNDADPAQQLDVYVAKSDKPTPVMVFFHGGGWLGGSKSRVPDWILKGVHDASFSVVSVEYRFADVAPHPAQVNDCMRAIQFIRHKAVDWNVDSGRIAVSGNSAGGHLALWVALHDDTADADSVDPVTRQSSRVTCAVSLAGPTDWSLLSDVKHLHPGYWRLLGYDGIKPVDEMDQEIMADASPITHVSKDDPPIMLIQGDKDRVVPQEHALNLHRELEDSGVTSELVIMKGANHLGGSTPDVFIRAGEFVRDQLGGQTAQ